MLFNGVEYDIDATGGITLPGGGAAPDYLKARIMESPEYGSAMATADLSQSMVSPQEVASGAFTAEQAADFNSSLDAPLIGLEGVNNTSTTGFDMSTSDMIGLGNLAVAGYGAWDTHRANQENLGLAEDARDDRRKEYATSRQDRADRQASWA